MEPTTLDGPIELALPADSRMLRLVRLVASGLASTIGLDVDELDDLRIAVDEAVAALLEGGDGSRLELRFEVDAEAVTMAATVPAGGAPLDPERLEWSKQLLGAVCDEHQLEVDDGKVQVSFTKRRSTAA
ncbi:MAG: ATP-binding protein [Actinomycetota bacterium]|nr:ATP-binding protein [Acidimicrobiia bacterium]MDQ3292952.1 ATP-binding protein [Actinomycetota bacterium]